MITTATMNTPQVIYSQINKQILMSLGMSNLSHFSDGIMFDARILPMTQKGRGTRARVMSVMVTLEPSDTYSVKVSYAKGRFDRVTHFEESGIYADQLNDLLLSLDFDGKQVTNPRYWN